MAKQIITITEGMNDYPSYLHDGYIGFDSYDEAEAFAKENNGNVVELRQRFGRYFWESLGSAFGEFKLSSATYGDNYSEVWNLEDCDLETSEILTGLEEDGASQEEINEMAEKRRIIREAVAALGEGEAVLLYRGELYEVIKTSCMSYELGSWRYAIGVEIKREEE